MGKKRSEAEVIKGEGEQLIESYVGEEYSCQAYKERTQCSL